jgi:hypothetical protein
VIDRRTLLAASVAVALSCGTANHETDTAVSMKPAHGPLRTATEDRDVRAMLLDLAATNACAHIAGEFVGLSGTADRRPTAGETKRDSTRARRGRLWIERCRAERSDGEELTIELEGRGWRWVDRTSEKLGARFSVSQYVRFDAAVRARGKVDLSYARSERVARLMLSATRPVRASVRPRGAVDANAHGAWAALLGGAATLVGESPDEQAGERLAREGSRGLAERLSSGYTVVFDLCTGQKYEAIGALPEGELPEVPLPASGRVWKDNERVELMPGGVDLAGPFRRDELPMSFDVRVEAGDGVVTTVICSLEARRVAEAFLAGKPAPEVDTLAGQIVSPGKDETLRVEQAGCDLVLYTRPSGKTATFSYLVWPERKRTRALAPCDAP